MQSDKTSVLSFDQLPQAVANLWQKLDSIEKMLLAKSVEPKPKAGEWFNLLELCNYLPDRPAKATIYGYVAANSIPHHKGTKKLRFLKSEIDEWLKLGKQKTIAEVSKETDTYLSKKKGAITRK